MNHAILTNELDETTKSLIEKVEIMEKELNSKDEEIKKLKNELEFLKGVISNKNRKIFGASSEQVDLNQLSLFNEAEKFSDSNAEEPTLEEITYKRAKKNNYIGKKDNLANLERVVIEHKLEGDDLNCKDCGEPLTEIGVKSRKEIIRYIPAKLVVEEHVIYSYACKSCEKETGESNIISAPTPQTIFYNSMASNELIAHTIILKYQHAMPLYRQEAYFDMMGATLSRQTLCNWTMSAAEALEPIYNHMKKELINRNYIHADETTLKVINDNGKDSKSKKYMWLYMNETESGPVILYDYQSTRSSSCPKSFLGDFRGFLQTDGYNGYNSVSNATRLYCLAHIRRYFHNIIVDLDEEALKNSRAIIGFNYCEQIYKLEKELRESYSSDENYYDVRFEVRSKQLTPIIDKFIEYVEIEIKNALPRSPLGKALEYAKKHLPGLKNVLLDGSLEVDNNAAERAIKPFVIGRKNFLFANTAKGATSSANIYSIVETAKANKLVVERYLVYLFDNLSKIDLSDGESLENLMPWSNKIPENMKIKDKK
ncbi:IS66 family transposase [Clostridium beijerinckii]|uniref:IS66 family transposase n=1 Tax=Clostridium beijerinckii TaxID=1520 RepID=A0AAW3WHG1_CLOBE|nr:IS66 family transposase [Clostridium beijerinckii]MBC2460532.1 IS66 family transposase [Clostridium beijerinckii]MBC2478034.1 IS66 family transposase [Clostridium beijerinckii]NOV59733.1 transposase [Clostridium beijerinckii]NOV59788.1 transposase [Clostridium beijerinckii]NOV59861.1 transposase [Clostridium beijerinckii]